MTIVDDFRAAEQEAAGRGLTGPQHAGSRSAWAAARLMDAPAAELTIVADGDLRLPWGASGQDAAVAESIQFTAGPGPTAQAVESGLLARISHQMLHWCWPGLANPLVQRTGFRSVVAIPLDDIAVLTVYFDDPTGCQSVDSGTAALVAGLTMIALAGDPSFTTIESITQWPHPAGRRRLQVPVATGMVMAALSVETADAMAVLRARAFATGRSIDDVAEGIVADAQGIEGLR